MTRAPEQGSARLFIVVIAVLLLLVGSFLLSQQLYVWDAWLFVALALLVLILVSLSDAELGERLVRHAKALLPRHGPGWVRAGAVAIAGYVAWSARRQAPGYDYAGLFLVWVLAVVGFTLSLVVPPMRQWRPTLKRAAWERWALLGLLVTAGLLRSVALGRVPANLGGDEGTQLRAGLDLVARPMGNPFATGWYSVPTMSFLAYGLAMRLFGATIAGGRALSALAGTVTVLGTYTLGRGVAGRRAGWIAAVIVAVSAYHIHYSRLASNQIFDPLVGVLVLYLVWIAAGYGRRGRAGREGGGARYWGLAGVVAGLGWYAYFGARWVTFLVVLVVAWRAWAERDFLRRHGRGLLLFALGWLVVVLPLLGWYLQHPSALTERYNAVSIFASGWLEREVEITGKTALALMLQQVWRAATAFHLTPDPTFWYRPEHPLVDFVTGALMLVGLVEAVLRWRWPSRALILIWFGSTMTMAWVLTENPPSSQRGLLLLPAAALLASLGLARLWALFGGGARTYRAFVGVVLVAVATLNVIFYFAVYTPRRVYGNPTAERATALGRYTLAHPEPVCPTAKAALCPGRIYLLGPPWMYWEFGTLSFMLRNFPGEDVPLEALPPDLVGPIRFAIVPERAGELMDVRVLYPGGEEIALRAPDGRLLMWIYDWGGA